jgi:hypothetical protein
MNQVRRGASWSGGERNRVFQNQGVNGDGMPSFIDISALSGMDFADDARSLGVTDWDHDGDLDVWIHNRTAPRLRLMLNQHQSAQDFVSLRLIGTTSNRDAIGARLRITLRDGKHPHIRTGRAGSAFLSQSSKWLHVGLGSQRDIETVSVRWPNGIEESFVGVQVGRRMLLIEGTGTAQPGRDREKINLVPGPLESLPPRATTILPRQVPAPDFAFLPKTTEPIWLILWSETCPHCQEELRAITAAEALFKERGLSVCAISLEDPASSPFLKEIGFPFPVERIDETVLARIQGLQATLFDQPAPLSVPFGLLLGSGQERPITAIIRGVVGPEQVLSLLLLANADDTRLRDAAAPFAGQWYTKPQPSSNLLQHLGEKMHAHDRLASAYYYQKAGQLEIAARIHCDVGMEAGGQSRPVESERAFRKAIALMPSFSKAHNNLGALLANQKRYDEAAVCFRMALKHEPTNGKARHNLELLDQLR